MNIICAWHTEKNMIKTSTMKAFRRFFPRACQAARIHGRLQALMQIISFNFYSALMLSPAIKLFVMCPQAFSFSANFKGYSFLPRIANLETIYREEAFGVVLLLHDLNQGIKTTSTPQVSFPYCYLHLEITFSVIVEI